MSPSSEAALQDSLRTELAARGITEAQQADYLVREMKYARANWPWMGVVFVWNLNFQAVVAQTDEKWGFGVLRQDYSPRPAYTALQKMQK